MYVCMYVSMYVCTYVDTLYLHISEIRRRKHIGIKAELIQTGVDIFLAYF